MDTPNGYPLPLTYRPLTEHPVVVKKEGVALKQYPEVCIPAEEEIGPNEIRLICCGSGNPIVRRAQAATSWLCQLGNGDNFVFDVGGGAVQNLWSLGYSPAIFDKLFLTHLHLDHVGDFHVLFDAMGWARNAPLQVWGPSGYTKEQGTEVFCDLMHRAALWHIESKRGLVPSSGAEIVAHEFDVSQLSLENPRTLVYDENGVKIYAFPVIHCIFGSIAYRLEWNDLSFTFHGDGSPSSFEAEQAQGVDVFMHEGFLDPVTFSEKANVPLQNTKLIVGEHTTGDKFGQLMNIARPKLGVAYHYFLDDDTIDPFYDLYHQTCDMPLVLAADFTTINITPEQIVTRQAKTNPLHWPAPAPPPKDPSQMQLATRSESKIPQWVADTLISGE
jgi:ribonuclease Z